jgi:hypothetical protein
MHRQRGQRLRTMDRENERGGDPWRRSTKEQGGSTRGRRRDGQSRSPFFGHNLRLTLGLIFGVRVGERDCGRSSLRHHGRGGTRDGRGGRRRRAVHGKGA